MKFLMDNRGGIFLTVVAVLAGILLGIAVYGNWQDAEAILGGEGNVSLVDNPHNFSSTSTSTSVQATVEDRICIFCHTPHHALMTNALLNGPLWNHELSTASYSGKVWTPQIANDPPYDVNVGYVNVLTTQPNQPDGSSRMCMGCHDGTIGIGNIVSSDDITMDTSHECLDENGRLDKDGVGCANLVIGDLRQKHTVSIPMNDLLLSASALACASQTTKLKYPWSNPLGLANSVFLRPTATKYPYPSGDPGVSSGFPNAKYKTGYSYGVQCSTCHDPHFWDVDSGELGYKFLVMANLSDLCKACHYDC